MVATRVAILQDSKWVIPGPNRPSREPHYFGNFYHVIYWRASQKNTVNEVLEFFKKFVVLISLKITQKTKNETVGLYRFG